MKHRASSTHRMATPDRHHGQTDNRTNGRVSVSYRCSLTQI